MRLQPAPQDGNGQDGQVEAALEPGRLKLSAPLVFVNKLVLKRGDACSFMNYLGLPQQQR